MSTPRALNSRVRALLSWLTLVVALAGGAVAVTLALLQPDEFDWALAAAASAGVASIAALGGLLLRHAERRVTHASAAVWSALYDLSHGAFGDDDAGALLIDAELGDEAAAWNELIAKRADRAALDAEREALDALASRGGGGQGGADVLDLLPQGVIAIGIGGRIECANVAAAVFLRAARDHLLGQPIAETGLGETVVELVSQVRSGGQRRGSVEVRETTEPDHGPTVLRYSARRAGRGEAGSIVLIIEDVTQQRLADETRTTLLASAAHELRTPLTNIRLWVEEFIDAPDDDTATRNEAINVIGQESRRLERIVNDVLSVNELEAGSVRLQLGDIRLDAMFDELESDFRAQAEEKGITLRFDLPPRVPVIQGDRDRFELVMHNLVGNALKYTPSGGEVTLTLEESDREIEIAVTDTGFGIAPEEQDKVFERFYRAGNARIETITGTGLGLAIAREVVRRHGGEIVLSSKLNEGSTFTVRLPKQEQRAKAA